jgi:TolB-like protein
LIWPTRLRTPARDQLARILASPEFIASHRLHDFLSYIVEETLAERGNRIKAYAIAISVFGRGQDFDKHNDPVVRIGAGSLRRALERYFLTAGTADEIVITIPKGGYQPQFEVRVKAAPAASMPDDPQPLVTPQRPGSGRTNDAWTRVRLAVVGVFALSLASVAVYGLTQQRLSPSTSLDPTNSLGPTLSIRPFAQISTSEESARYANGIKDELITQLARFKELTVLEQEPPRSQSLSGSDTGIRGQFGAQYALEGSVRIRARNLRVLVRLLDSATTQVLWSQSYDKDLGETGDIDTAIASDVATAVGQPYGALFNNTPRQVSSQRPEKALGGECLSRFYRYRKVLDQVEHARARDCMEQTTRRFPSDATGWAMLAYLYLDEDRFDLNRKSGAPPGKVRAREAAERAVQLDQSNVRALQSLMTVLFFAQEPAAALQLGKRALTLNPNDTELLAEVGSRVAQAGDWERGGGMMERAVFESPGLSGLFVGLIAQAAYMQGNDTKAVEWIRRTDLKQFSIYHFIAALIFARAGLEVEATASRSAFLKMRPRFFDNFEAELAMRNFNARDRVILTEGAKQAGFPVAATKNDG